MNFTFASIKAALVSRLSQLQNWTINILTLGVFSRILDVIAYGSEKVVFYLELLYKNSFIITASDNAALVVKARELSYKAHRKIGAAGFIRIESDPGFSIALATYTGPTVFIPRWTTFGDINATVNAYTTEDATYYTGTIVAHRNLTALDSPVNLGSGKVGFNVSTHGFPVGQTVTIQGTQNYDGNYPINSSTSINEIVIVFSSDYIPEVFDGTEKIFTGHVYIPIKEGIPKEFTYIASGIIDESFIVFSDKIDNDQIQEFIVDTSGEILYDINIVDDIFITNDLVNYSCTVESLPSFTGITSTFGDGVTTKKLSTNDRVRVRYAETKGLTGDIITTGVLTQFKSVVLDLEGNPAAIYPTNDSTIIGGDDVEDNEHIRHFAPSLFYAGYRAHSDDDWVVILENHPLIRKAITWTNFDIGDTTVGFTNSIVYIAAVSSSGDALTQGQKDDIVVNYLKKTKKGLTDVAQFQDLKIINAQFRITGKSKPVPTNGLINEISTSLIDTYGILNIAFAQSIYESEAITSISESSNDIIYHHTEVWHVEKSEHYPEINDTVGSRKITVSFITTDPAKAVMLQTGKVEIWILRKIDGVLQSPLQIGQCNIITPTILEGINDYTIVGGVVNYATNTITYNITDIIDDIPPDTGSTFGVQNPTNTDSDGYFLRIAYKTKDGNGNLLNDIRLPYFYNIIDVDVEDIDNYTTFTI